MGNTVLHAYMHTYVHACMHADHTAAVGDASLRRVLLQRGHVGAAHQRGALQGPGGAAGGLAGRLQGRGVYVRGLVGLFVCLFLLSFFKLKKYLKHAPNKEKKTKHIPPPAPPPTKKKSQCEPKIAAAVLLWKPVEGGGYIGADRKEGPMWQPSNDAQGCVET